MNSEVALTKEEKLKKLNEKLNAMLKEKNCDPVIQKVLPTTYTKPIDTTQSKTLDYEKYELPEKTKRIHKYKDSRVLRKAAGTVWYDKTMYEWPENDYRIFCGNLGKYVSDEMLASGFRRYSSFQKARVVRDRRTGINRGYGFVSFTDPSDFLKALKEMNGKHVGNRPVALTKSTWKDRELNSYRNKALPSDFRTNSQKYTNKVCINFKYISPY